MTAMLSPDHDVTDADWLGHHEQIGFELGWDHAHHGLRPPAEDLAQQPSLRHGLLAGQAAFGARTLSATPAVRQWLALRCHAWLRGIEVELVQVTPHYLQQLQVSHCPITRQPLAAQAGAATTRTPAEPVVTPAVYASVERVRLDAGYAAGNLAVLSRTAQHARGHLGHAEARDCADKLAANGVHRLAGLDAAQWMRLSVLCSFVEPLSHEQACTIPLCVLPPNRLRLFNPAQALQVLVSRQLLTPGWSRRINRFEQLLASSAMRHGFQRFFMTLLPRVLEHGAPHAPPARWAVEDAWQHPLVQQRWLAFSSRLTAAECEALVRRAGHSGVSDVRVDHTSAEQATEGWRLASHGHVEAHAQPLRPLRRGSRARMPAGDQSGGQRWPSGGQVGRPAAQLALLV